MKKIKYLLLFATLLSLNACNVSSQVTSNVTYESATLTMDALESGGIALLPIVAGSGVEGYRRPFGEAINQNAVNSFTNYMPWNETLESFNNLGIVNEYNTAIRSYRESGIMNQQVLAQMSEATGKNYFIFIQLMPPSADRNVSYNAWTGGISTQETKSVTAYGLIWSYEEGDVVWEGAATAEVTTGDYSYTDETDMERANKVAEALVQAIKS